MAIKSVRSTELSRRRFIESFNKRSHAAEGRFGESLFTAGQSHGPELNVVRNPCRLPKVEGAGPRANVRKTEQPKSRHTPGRTNTKPFIDKHMLPIMALFPKWHEPEKLKCRLIHEHKLDVIACV